MPTARPVPDGRSVRAPAPEPILALDGISKSFPGVKALDQELGQLSGGNQQKVVIAKWLATKPRVIVLDEPTKGIDIGSKAAVHEFMTELAAQGLAVILVSSEIPEVLGMSDRVVVMREGRIVGTFEREGLTPEKLVRAAAGIREVA